MSIFYIGALFVGSVFWLAVIAWLVAGYIPKIKAFFEKSVDGYHLTKKRASDSRKIKTQADDYHHEQIQES